eukprot:CAMPEP_0113246636 /NCGR_PEP_ID=MMETSP0008_2-20120614/9563_1 /TAXON_ID=97485 /ORGANISM="Prymnesium parvum" /LENGTH=32 /DNA_ID=CAMNT_0000094379 /DNA_START=68 /DNA_END=163 /DNA_ORIENTATION=+ /assembly_acc=CAM_ASM_000153
MKRAGMPARRDADVVPKQEVIYSSLPSSGIAA